MTDLTTWLLDQIEADEAVAKAATEGPDPANAEHIARNDPAATLRRCAALREVVELHTEGHYCPVPSGMESWFGFDEDCPTLRALAAAYSDRGGYAEAVGL